MWNKLTKNKIVNSSVIGTIYFPIIPYTNLGNWMFQYAAAVSVAKRDGKAIAVYLEDKTKRIALEQYRKLLFGDVLVVDSMPHGTVTYEQPEFKYSPMPDFRGFKDIIMRGFFQSEKYFDKELVRSRFRPSNEQVDYLQCKYGAWLSRANVTGVSVRHGKDYLAGCDMHPFVGARYFHDAIGRLADCDDYIVCSDDIAWCRDFFSREFPDKRFLFCEGESALNQLYLQSLCKNNIVSNSSFSWWGAWLNENEGKLVIAPSMWFGPMATYRDIDWQDIYFDGMIVQTNGPNLYEWINMQFRFRYNQLRCLYARIKRTAIGMFSSMCCEVEE